MEPKKLLRLKSFDTDTGCFRNGLFFAKEMYDFCGKTIDWNKARLRPENKSWFFHPDLGEWTWDTKWFEPAESEYIVTNTKGKVKIEKSFFVCESPEHKNLVLNKIQDDYPHIKWNSGVKTLSYSPQGNVIKVTDEGNKTIS